jgi:hypothetical protein
VHYLAHGAPIHNVVPLVEPLRVFLVAQLGLNLNDLGIFATCADVQDVRGLTQSESAQGKQQEAPIKGWGPVPHLWGTEEHVKPQR